MDTIWGACTKRTADEASKFSLAWLDDKASHTPAKALACIAKLQKDHEEVFRTHPELDASFHRETQRLQDPDPKASMDAAWSLPPLLYRELIKVVVEYEAARDIYIRLKLTTSTATRGELLESVFLEAPYADSSTCLIWHVWVPETEGEKKRQDETDRNTPRAYRDVDYVWLWATYYSRTYGLPPFLEICKAWTARWTTAEVEQWRDRKEKKEIGNLGLPPLSPPPTPSLPQGSYFLLTHSYPNLSHSARIDTWKVAYFARVGQILLEAEIAARNSNPERRAHTLTDFFLNGPTTAYGDEFGCIKWPGIGALRDGSYLLTPAGSFFVWGSWRFVFTKLSAPTGTGRSFSLDSAYSAIDANTADMPSDRSVTREWWQQYRGHILARINAL